MHQFNTQSEGTMQFDFYLNHKINLGFGPTDGMDADKALQSGDMELHSR